MNSPILSDWPGDESKYIGYKYLCQKIMCGTTSTSILGDPSLPLTLPAVFQSFIGRGGIFKKFGLDILKFLNYDWDFISY